MNAPVPRAQPAAPRAQPAAPRVEPAAQRVEPAAPSWFRVLWRGMLFLELAAFFAAAATIVRALIGGFGGEPLPLAVAAVATLVAGAVVLPLAAMVDVPDALFCHWLPARRMARGRCPACGYDTGHAPATECPECHAQLVAPAPYAATVRTLRRALLIAAPAWLAGGALGLALALRDEHAFTVEASARVARDATTEVVRRPRAGLASFAHLQWTRAEGFAGPPPFADSKERGWTPKAASPSDAAPSK